MKDTTADDRWRTHTVAAIAYARYTVVKHESVTI
jgi:hypothetical protein